MKRIIALVLILVSLFSFASCSGEKSYEEDFGVKKILNSFEYTIYLNIFQNGEASKYTGTNFNKEGIFTKLYDSFGGVERYYVWGYSDETLCCDFQWEFVPTDTASLPPVGSHVKVSGKFIEDSDALDGYRMIDATVTTIMEYSPEAGQIDMTTMSPTLVRVQIINMLNFPSEYVGKSVKVFARVMSSGKIQHPYYDNAWSMSVDTVDALPSIGTYVTVVGTFDGTTSSNSKIIATNVTVG